MSATGSDAPVDHTPTLDERDGLDRSGPEPRIARRAAARLVTGATPDTEVDLDELAASSRAARRLAATAAAVDAYLDRDPEQAARLEAAVHEAWQAAGQDPGRFAQTTSELRAQVITLATVDTASQEAPAAVARLRADLAEYLATVEGLTGQLPWP
jgi:ParB-like chromosome segregation protein Spo0J